MAAGARSPTPIWTRKPWLRFRPVRSLSMPSIFPQTGRIRQRTGRVRPGCFAMGRCLIGAGTADSGTMYKAGDKLGEEKHNLTIPETPAHGHTVGDSGNHRHWSCGSLPRNFQWDACEGNDAPVAVGYGDGCWHGNQVDGHTSWDGNHSHSLSRTGGGQPHNNMQPSIVVYMFQRTG